MATIQGANAEKRPRGSSSAAPEVRTSNANTMPDRSALEKTTKLTATIEFIQKRVATVVNNQKQIEKVKKAIEKLQKHQADGTVPKSLQINVNPSVEASMQSEVNNSFLAIAKDASAKMLTVLLEAREKEKGNLLLMNTSLCDITECRNAIRSLLEPLLTASLFPVTLDESGWNWITTTIDRMFRAQLLDAQINYNVNAFARQTREQNKRQTQAEAMEVAACATDDSIRAIARKEALLVFQKNGKGQAEQRKKADLAKQKKPSTQSQKNGKQAKAAPKSGKGKGKKVQGNGKGGNQNQGTKSKQKRTRGAPGSHRKD